MDQNFYTLREKLLVDFKYRWDKRKLRWCHPFKKIREKERQIHQGMGQEEEDDDEEEDVQAGWFVPQSTGILCEVNALEGELPGDWYADEDGSEAEEQEEEADEDDDMDGWF